MGDFKRYGKFYGALFFFLIYSIPMILSFSLRELKEKEIAFPDNAITNKLLK